MADKAMLVIDQGGQSTRALVYNSRREILANARFAIASQAQGLQVEQSLDEILQSVQQVIAEAFAALSANQQKLLTGVALIVQRASFVAVNKTTGKALAEVISWQDTRNIKLPAIEAKMPWQQEITGLRPNAHLGASKMAWLLEHNPLIKQAASENDVLFMPLGAVIAAFITNTKPEYTEPAIAQRTGLYDIGRGQFSEALCKHYQIPFHTMPKLCDSAKNWGDVALGTKTVPLVLVSGDQNALPYALGKSAQATVANIGTGAFVLSPCAKVCSVPKGLLKTLLFSENGHSYFALEGTVNNAANSLQALLKEQGESFNAKALSHALASEQNPGVCDNRLHGTGSPFWLSAKPLSFMGSETKRAQQVAVLESIVFALAININAMAQKQPIQKVLVAGGLSNFDGLCQRLASITGIEVVRGQSAELSSEAAAVLCLPSANNSAKLTSFKPISDAALLARFELFKQLLPK